MTDEEQLAALLERVEIELSALKVLREHLDKIGKDISLIEEQIRNGEFDE